MMAEIKPAVLLAPVAREIPRESGSATRNTTNPAKNSRFQLTLISFDSEI